MREELERETDRLRRSWAGHDPQWLASYLVHGVEDPRVNAQSILTRHFLVTQHFGNEFAGLSMEEQRFGAVMRWWNGLNVVDDDQETRESIGHALQVGSDNAEGLPIPPWVLRAFKSLPVMADRIQVPNYVEQLCARNGGEESVRDTFSSLWRDALCARDAGMLRVLEPACGSANDCRFMKRYGMSRFVDYTGVDLNGDNVANARRLAEWGRFEVGNVFELEYGDRTFDAVYMQDLLEHLSLTGMEEAIAEMCRVTRRALAVGFFSMHEGEQDIVRAVEDYHCNTLSLRRTRSRFERHGFRSRVIHLDSLLHWELGCAPYHNPHAYTFLLEREILA
jgi:SAM-dependent methyltransferase